LSGDQLRNRAITDTFEPGSVVKPLIVGLALEEGLVEPQTLIETGSGKMPFAGAVISDSHPNGTLTVEGVVQKSSNIGTAKIAMQLESEDMWRLYSQAGFGQKPQIVFPGAAPGCLRPHKSWRPIEKATMSYGYGLSASLFQMARSYSIFSGDGQIIPITMLKSPGVATGTPIISAHTAAQVRKMLKMAAGPGGTGQKAQTIGYSVGGKSGTAVKQVGKGYGTAGNRKYRAWFVGMAPIERPRIIVGVMIDEPSAGQYYGGAVAAPVFSDVVQQALRMMAVQPDVAVVPQIVAVVEESF
jgi:cell division protein FtsI (penicillin-binding protein 3)